VSNRDNFATDHDNGTDRDFTGCLRQQGLIECRAHRDDILIGFAH
jgi:hypothetical protein